MILQIPVHIPPEGSLIPQASYILMQKFLQEFNQRAVDKFIAGQIEHSGSILDRDCLIEAEAEIIDLMFYIQAEKERRLKRKNENL